MHDLFEEASEWMFDGLKENAQQTVRYVRGANGVQVKATIGQTEFELIDSETQAVTSYESRDFLIHAEDLVIGGATIEPQRGDKIEETSGGTTYTYEVLAPGRQPVWKFADRYRQVRRIHTKLIGET